MIMPYKDKEKQKEYLRMHYEKNKENNRDAKTKAIKEWRLNNKERVSSYNADYAKKHRDDINKREKNRRHNDPLYRIKLNLRSRIRKTIINKTGKTTDILGCGYDEVRYYISNKFKEGMSWDNYGEWHIDHIKPLAMANTEKETYELCHYTNLQPLWAIENLQKGCNNLI
tara:strand:- start:201 stop:710 length:510 start_codon:yes stop_codon:yes gene_type:complete